MGRGGAVAQAGRADVENTKLAKEIAQLRVRNQELNDTVMKLTTEKEAQKETFREAKLSAVQDWRNKFTQLEAFHNKYVEDHGAKEMAQAKKIKDLTAKLEEAQLLNDDLTWKLKKCEEDLDATRALASSAVQHQFKMLSGMFGVYKIKQMEIGFNHWVSVSHVQKLENEIGRMKFELNLANMKTGLQFLNKIFKRWKNQDLYGGFFGMQQNFNKWKEDNALAYNLAKMNTAQKAEALRRLQQILNVWGGKACARELYNMYSHFKYEKRIAHITEQADRKLRKMRSGAGMRFWKEYIAIEKENRAKQIVENMKKEIAELKDELAKAELEVEKLMAKYLGVRHSAFFDKIDRIMKAWRFGAIGLMFVDWVRWTKDTIQFRTENAGKASREELLAELTAYEKEIKTLKNQIKALERENADQGLALGARDTEIMMLKEKARALEAKTATLYDEGFAKGNQDKDEALGKLMERFLQAARGAFIDKVNEILLAWKYGNLGMMYSQWKTVVNAAKRPAIDQAARIEELEALLKTANLKIAELETKLEAHEKASVEAQRLNEAKIVELNAQIDTLNQAKAKLEGEVEAAKTKLDTELAHQAEAHKKAVETADEARKDAEEKEAAAKQEAAAHAEEKKTALANVTKLKGEVETKEQEHEETKKQAQRDIELLNTQIKKKETKIEEHKANIEKQEVLRKEVQANAANLQGENKKLSAHNSTLQQTVEDHRKEAESLREGQRQATKEKKESEAKDTKIAELSGKASDAEAAAAKSDGAAKAAEAAAEEQRKRSEKAAAKAE